jgi:hypothetical protein
MFAWVPVLMGKSDIATIIGGKIVEAGGYPENRASVIGWTLHIVIAIAYVKLYALVVSLPGFPQVARAGLKARLVAGLIAALVIGWLTTAMANPAISATISLASGQGWPAELASPYLKLGLPLWNHLGFFAITWLIVVVTPSLIALGSPAERAVSRPAAVT